MVKKLKNKLAVVTGGSSGIGKAVARRLLEAGANVAICARNEERLRRAAAEISEATDLEIGAEELGEIFAQPCDVSSEREISHFIRSVQEKFGGIDILVNNAGTAARGRVVDLPVEEFDRAMATNVRGVFLFCKAVLPKMIEKQEGDIINISSIAAKMGMAGGAGYCASKWAVQGFSEALLEEVREDGIRVTTICPGYVDTSFHPSGMEKPRNDMIQPDDIAEIVHQAVTLPQTATIKDVVVRPRIPVK